MYLQFFFFRFTFANNTNLTCDEPERLRTIVILAGLAKYLHWKFASLCHFKFAILCPQSSFPRTYFFSQIRCANQLNTVLYNAKNQTENWKVNMPRKGIARPQSQFPNSCVFFFLCARFIQCIPSIYLPNLLQEIYGSILGICKSLTDTWCVEIGTEDTQFPEKEYRNVSLQYNARWQLVLNNVVLKSWTTLCYTVWYLSCR
jgi:hypothetical protein